MRSPIPHIDRDEYSAPFFDASGSGVLLIRSCRRCSALWAPDRRFCAVCQSDDLVWCPASGRGRLITWTIDRQHGDTGSSIVAGLVELEEGPWLPARVKSDPAQLHGGMPVLATFPTYKDNGDETVPMFVHATPQTPAGDPSKEANHDLERVEH